MQTLPSRSALIDEFLERNRLDGWLSWRPDELVLQTGHAPYWGMSFLLSLRSGDQILFAPALEPEADLPAHIQIEKYPWGRIDCNDPFKILAGRIDAALQQRRMERIRVGVSSAPGRSSLPILSGEHPPLADGVARELSRGMRCGAKLDAAFLGLYKYKTQIEIQRIRVANGVALTGLEAWRKALVPGVTEAEAAAACESAIHCRTGKDGVVSARAWAMVQSGPNTAMAGCFNQSSGRRFEAGDLVLIELATCVNGYWSDLTRTGIVGDIISQRAVLLLAVHAAQSAAIAVVAPGVPAHDVDAAARESLRHDGFGDFFTLGTGHHVGFRYHDPGFALMPGSSDLLEAGMVLTIEPGAYLGHRKIGARIEDNVAVTASGADILSAESSQAQ